MRLLDLFKKRSPPCDSTHYPGAGISLEDLTSALAVIETLGPEVDRRILRAEVVGDGRLTVSTGHVTGFLNSDHHEFVLQRQSGTWRIVSHQNFLS
jgi:hypothetical protein